MEREELRRVSLKGSERPPSTVARKFSVTAYYGWAFTNQHILYVLDSAGDETGRILQVNIAGEPLTSGAGQFAGRHWGLLEWTLDFDVPGESELLTNLRTTTMVGLAGLGIAN
jgi:hypothetical protein